MQHSLPVPALIKGLGVIIGECVFGLNGPFLFERYGLSTPLAITTGVMLGAVAGFCVAALGLSFRHAERVAKAEHGLPANAHLRGTRA